MQQDAEQTSLDPVFLQALWRTGSTYLWGKFRSREEFRGYFEPLHESLYCKTREKLVADYQRASQKFGHSSISHNYYDEFNIRATGGVEHFERRFTLERYALAPDENDPELERYIQSLIDDSAERGQAAVMQFNRGVLRAEWMKERFGGTHLYLNRNPADMLNSYRQNGYYLPTYLAIIGQNAHNPIFAEAAERYGVTPYDVQAAFKGRDLTEQQVKSKSFQSTLRHFMREARSLDEQDERDIVAFFWTLGLAQSTRYADMIIDTDMMIEPGGKSMPEILKDITDIEFDFSDLKVTTTNKDSLEVSDAMKDIIRRAADVMHPNWSRLKDFPLSKNTAVQLISTL